MNRISAAGRGTGILTVGAVLANLVGRGFFMPPVVTVIIATTRTGHVWLR